ncbi:MAG: hypothetical protein ACR2GA_00005, partial [Chloroflexota bacterium]
LWRLRVVKILSSIRVHGSSLSSAEIAEGQRVSLAAADYFEQQGDWESFSLALDGYMGVSYRGGMHRDVIQAGERRLNAPTLTAMERGDALQSIVWAHHNLGDYERCIAFGYEALRQTQPGESLIHVTLAVAVAMQAACFSGQWAACVDFMPSIEEIRNQIQDESGARLLTPAYMSALHLAMARDDRAAADVAAAFLRRILPTPSESPVSAIIDACREDDPAKADSANFPFAATVMLPLQFFTERGLAPPDAVLDYIQREPECGSIDLIVRCREIALALAAADTARLAAAIDDAESHGLIPHAARMRIILAQLTQNPTPLEQARPVLERLQDRQFLRRLEEVATSLR